VQVDVVMRGIKQCHLISKIFT